MSFLGVAQAKMNIFCSLGEPNTFFVVFMFFCKTKGECRNSANTSIAKMLRIVDPQAQGTAPAGISKFKFLQIVTNGIRVKKQLFAIRMSYFVAMT